MVCRAFKKPNPSHKQGYEAWNYMRNMNYRPPSYPNNQNLMPNNFNPNQSQTPNFHQPPFLAEALNSSSCTFDNQMVEIPKLDSPSISTSFATNDTNFASEEAHEDIKSSFGSHFSEWKSFDKLLGSSSSSSHQFIGSSSSFDYANMPLVPHNDELDAQSHLSHVLECFPDL